MVLWELSHNSVSKRASQTTCHTETVFFPVMVTFQWQPSFKILGADALGMFDTPGVLALTCFIPRLTLKH